MWRRERWRRRARPTTPRRCHARISRSAQRPARALGQRRRAYRAPSSRYRSSCSTSSHCCSICSSSRRSPQPGASYCALQLTWLWYGRRRTAGRVGDAEIEHVFGARPWARSSTCSAPRNNGSDCPSLRRGHRNRPVAARSHSCCLPPPPPARRPTPSRSKRRLGAAGLGSPPSTIRTRARRLGAARHGASAPLLVLLPPRWVVVASLRSATRESVKQFHVSDRSNAVFATMQYLRVKMKYI